MRKWVKYKSCKIFDSTLAIFWPIEDLSTHSVDVAYLGTFKFCETGWILVLKSGHCSLGVEEQD